MLSELFQWITSNSHLVAMTGALGILLFACTLFVAPWLIARLPADYFVNHRKINQNSGPARWGIWLSRNIIGALLMTMGLVMLVTPGPGILMLIVGLSVCDFEQKHQLIAKLALRPNILASLNWIRTKASKPPFLENTAAPSEPR